MWTSVWGCSVHLGFFRYLCTSCIWETANHIEYFLHPRKSKLSSFLETAASTADIFSILGHKNIPCQSYAYVVFFYPRESRLSLFSLHGQRFPQFSKLPYLGMKLGHWTKFPKLHVYPGGRKLIFAPWAAFSEIGAVFQNWHIWAWNLAIRQSSRSCTYTLSLPQRVEIELIFTLWAVVSEIWADFQNCHIRA